jgi:hypothetical protein
MEVFSRVMDYKCNPCLCCCQEKSDSAAEAAFHLWEAEQAPVERTPAAILADIGAIREWLPREARLVDPDTEKLGIQTMRRGLARL